ncbi:MAG TPA: LysM peptidoglycan-binding domain-containing protein [bacterium]
MKYTTLFVVAALTGFLTIGCAGKKRIEGNEIPTQPMSNEVVTPPAPMAETAAPPAPEISTPPEATPESKPEPPPAAEVKEPEPCDKYIVVTGDTLWGISGMSNHYQDFFQWPLIFKANRDQITDPDLIYPKQEFCIRKDFPKADIDKARKDASDTPKYVPHTKPRETLPLNYF